MYEATPTFSKPLLGSEDIRGWALLIFLTYEARLGSPYVLTLPLLTCLCQQGSFSPKLTVTAY